MLMVMHGDRLTACVCIFTGWTPERADFLRSLVGAGINIIALILTHRIEDARGMMEADPLPCRHLLLEPPNVQEGLLKL